MKILQAVSHYVPAHGLGGVLQVAYHQSRALRDLGHDVRVCTSNLESATTDLAVPIDQPVMVDGVTVFYEDIPFWRYWGFSPRMVVRLWREIAWADVVLVHGNFQFARLAAATIARWQGRPYVIFAHSSLRWRALRSGSRYQKLGYVFGLEGANFLGAEFVAFNAREEWEDSAFREMGRVIANGIDPGVFSPLPERGGFRRRYPQLQDRMVYVYLGRIDIAQKASDRLVRAFAVYCETHADAALVLAGPAEGNDGIIIAGLVAELGLADRVVMPGLVTGAEKTSLLRDADVFVLASHYEGLSIALLEAMFVGLPVIVTTGVGLHTQIAQSGAGLIAGNTELELAQAMQQARNTEWRTAAGEAARRLVLRAHLWPAICRELVAMLSCSVPFPVV